MTGEMLKGATEFADRLCELICYSGLTTHTKNKLLEFVNKVIDEFDDRTNDTLDDLFTNAISDLDKAINILQ